MKHLRPLTLAAFVALTPPAFAQVSINFESPSPADGRYSNNAPWDETGGFHFEIGAFAPGFTPTSANTASWAGQWSVANQGGQSGATTWVNDGGDTWFTGAGAITTYSGAFVGGAQIYIWGYDSKASGVREWLLVTDPAWKLPGTLPVAAPPTTMSISSTAIAVVGQIASAGEVLKSESVNLSAVPEPGSVCTLAGMIVLGVSLRRRRSRV